MKPRPQTDVANLVVLITLYVQSPSETVLVAIRKEVERESESTKQAIENLAAAAQAGHLTRKQLSDALVDALAKAGQAEVANGRRSGMSKETKNSLIASAGGVVGAVAVAIITALSPSKPTPPPVVINNGPTVSTPANTAPGGGSTGTTGQPKQPSP